LLQSKDPGVASAGSARGAAAGESIPLRPEVEVSRASNLFLFAQANSSRVADAGCSDSTIAGSKGRLFLPGCTGFQQVSMAASDGVS
jgi:hypothetical protein